MLASILPGLREIRAPLAAGYLWLVTGWLLLHDRVETGSGAAGAVSALTEFRDAVGLGGIAAAATFLAYLLGALWEPISSRLGEALWGARSSLRELRSDLPKVTTVNELTPHYPPPFLRVSASAWNRLWLIGQRRFAEVEETLGARLGSRFGLDATRKAYGEFLPRLLRFVDREYEWNTAEAARDEKALDDARRQVYEFEFSSRRDSWWVRETVDFAQDLPGEFVYSELPRFTDPVLGFEKRGVGIKILTEPLVTVRLFDELPLVARRLTGEQPEAALEASRMKGEVEFRHAVAIPMAIAVGVLTFGLGFPWWAWIAASFAGVIAAYALLADGWRRDSARNDYLVDLLSIGKAESPTFERLLERAKQATGAGEPEAHVAEATAETTPQRPPDMTSLDGAAADTAGDGMAETRTETTPGIS